MMNNKGLENLSISEKENRYGFAGRVYKKYTFQKMVKKPREREQKKQIYTNAKKAENGCLKGSKKI